MQSRFNPYLHFKDDARAAMEFYQSVFGGELEFSTFGENHMSDDPNEVDKLMHSSLTTEGLVLMAADTPPGMEYKPGGDVSLALSGKDESELRSYFEKLSAGGTVTIPLDRAPWGDDIFGMLKDKFGKTWMVNIVASK